MPEERGRRGDVTLLGDPRLVVTVRGGPRVAEKIAVAPGGHVVVGRTDKADLVLAHDAAIAATHCEIRWDGARARVRDLGSGPGTTADGVRVEGEVEVRSGAFLRVGATALSLHVEAATPTPRDLAPRLSELAAEKREVVTAVRAGGARAFAVLDAGRDPRVLALCREAIDPCRSLYEGVAGEALEAVAPHLVELRADSELVDRLVGEGWGHRWGVLLGAAASFAEVRRHLRRFLLVQDDEGDATFYFRFYDPRTLRTFLPACTPRQRAELFGPIAWFVCEDARGAPLSFSPDVAQAEAS